MDRERFVRVQEAVVEALERDGDARAEFLRALQANDEELHDDVVRLLGRATAADEAMVPPIEAMMGPAGGGGGADDDDPLVGRSLGGFTLEALIGVGGMGRVYRARQKDPDRLVAVKVLGSRLLGRAAVKRFRQEAAVLGRLEHPGICRVYDAQTALLGVDSVPFIAMELVEGPTLMEAVGGEGLEEKLRVFVMICDAVEYAHQKAVIHRDLKPANIVVMRDGASGAWRPKVLDFGIARVIEPMLTGVPGAVPVEGEKPKPTNLTMTEATTLVGTVEYMSPEQLRGQAADIDTRTDVYALGLMLFELLSGERAFKSPSSWAAAIDRLTSDSPPRLRTAAPGLAAELDAIVSRATAPERERRYQAVADLADDIRRFLEHRPISARPPTWSYVAKKFVLRNTGLSVAIGVAALAVVGAVVGISLALGRAVHERDLATLSAARSRANEYVAGVQAAASALRANDVVTATARLDAAPQEHRGWEWRYLNGLLDQSERAFDATTAKDSAVWRVCPNRDGSRVIAMADRWIGVFDGPSGKLITSREYEGRGTVSVQWIEQEARLLVATGWGRHVLVLDAVTLKEVRRSEELHAETCAAVLSPDGSVLAVAAGEPMSSDGADRRVRLWDSKSWATVTEFEVEIGRAESLAFSGSGRMLMAVGAQRVRVWDVASRDVVWSGPGDRKVEAATWALGERAIVTAGEEGVQAWRANERGVWTRTATMGTVMSRAAAATASRDGRKVAIADGNLVRVWDMEKEQEVATLRGHSNRVRCVAALPASGTEHEPGFISGASEREIKVWPGHARLEVESFEAFADIAASPDGAWIAHQHGDEAQAVVLRRGTTLGIAGEARAERLIDAGSDLAFAVDGSSLARLRGGVFTQWAVGASATVAERQFERVFEHDERRARGVWACEGGKWLCTSPVDARTGAYAVRIIGPGVDRVQEWPRRVELPADGSRIDMPVLAMNRGGTLVAIGEGRVLTLLDVATMKPRAQLQLDKPVTAVAVSDDGARVAALSIGQVLVSVWRVVTNGSSAGDVAMLEGTWQPVAIAEKIMFDPSGTRLFASLHDGSVRVVAMLDQPAGSPPVLAEVAQLHGGVSWMMNLAISNDGSTLLAGSTWPARTAYVWRVRSEPRP